MFFKGAFTSLLLIAGRESIEVIEALLANADTPIDACTEVRNSAICTFPCERWWLLCYRKVLKFEDLEDVLYECALRSRVLPTHLALLWKDLTSSLGRWTSRDTAAAEASNSFVGDKVTDGLAHPTCSLAAAARWMRRRS